MEDMNSFRKEIDQIDQDLVRLLARRFDVCKRVAVYKNKTEMPMMQPGRIEAIKQRNGKWAELYDLDPAFLSSLYDLIIGEGCKLEDKIMAELSNKDD